jgi:hypothetical protein
MVLSESLLFFGSLHEVEFWLSWLQLFHSEIVYSSDGLVVAWAVKERPAQETGPSAVFRANVYQVIVDGAKPQDLTGAANAALEVINPSADCTIGDAASSAFVASRPKRIDGRMYSGWALDIMREHELTPAMVEAALQRSSVYSFNGYTAYRYQPLDGAEWIHAFTVVVDSDGDVVFMHK